MFYMKLKVIRILKITHETYHSNEAGKKYMSVSRYKAIKECESKSMAELNGEWEDDNKKVYFLGEYLHKWNEGKKEFQSFIDKNISDIYKGKNNAGDRYKDIIIMDKCIETIKNDKVAMMSLEGEKEVIITEELFGIPFKIMIDSLNHEKKAFTDLKTTRDIQKTYWNDENKERENFIIKWGYDIQLAVYAEILRRHLKMDKHYIPHILAVSKTDPPDKELIYMPREDIEPILDRIELDIPRVYDVWKGNAEPKGCGRCEYCLSKKKLKEAVYYMDIGI